ncbi:MAG: phage major capsid protein [Candidatus Thiodiazotropha sp. (ex Ctena orbiculata)]|nr:phage major capsid protein [Candidatus Thiodiazotropha taylori]
MPSQISSVIEDLGQGFEEFKRKQNDKLQLITDRIDQMETRANRPGVSMGGGLSGDVIEHQNAFSQWVKSGRNEDNLLDLQQKAMSVGVGADGGFAVPTAIDKQIEKLLRSISPIRQIARVVPVGTSDYKKLVNTGGLTSGWVSETAARPETNTPQLAEVIPPIGEIYCNPSITQHALDDVFFDAESWLSEEIADEIGVQEGAAFVSGDGINKPKGFLTYTTAATPDASRAFGTIEHVPTGVAGGWPTADADTADLLIDVVHSLRTPYRQGAVWVMNSTTLSTIRKLKDSNGQFIWQNTLVEGQPGMLLGYPVIEAEDMPDIAADSLSVAFGNFDRGYTIVDRMGTRVLRDPYTNKPYVHFYTTKRVGGAVVNSESIKLIKFGLT